MTMIVLAAVLLSGQAAPPARSAEDLTRDLNSAPPSAILTPRPAPVEPTQAQATTPPAPTSRPAARPAPPAPASPASPARSGSDLTRDLNSAPPAMVAPLPSRPAPVEPAAPLARTTPPATSSEPTRPRPTPAPVPAPAPAPAPAAAVVPTPTQAPADPLAALPFRIDLPEGFVIQPSDAGPQAKVYAVKRGERTFVMIYQGPASQFPIYDGQLIDAGGRASVVIEQDGRRRAVEHLYAKDLESRETHVWVSYLEGEDIDLAEQIAQSVEPR